MRDKYTFENILMSFFPVRCFTCGKPLPRYEEFQRLLDRYGSQDEALDKLKLRRVCCRRMILSHNPEYENIMNLYDYTQDQNLRIKM